MTRSRYTLKKKKNPGDDPSQSNSHYSEKKTKQLSYIVAYSN